MLRSWHSARTVHEVIAEEYRVLESVNYELGTYTPGDWGETLRGTLLLEGPATSAALSPLVFQQAGPCASSVSMSGTARFPCTPCQVASGAPPASSLVRFGSVSCKPGLTGDKAALGRSVSSSAGPLALPTLLCLALPSQSVWSPKLLLCISFLPQLGPVNWHDLSILVFVKKKGERIARRVQNAARQQRNHSPTN